MVWLIIIVTEVNNCIYIYMIIIWVKWINMVSLNSYNDTQWLYDVA